MTTQALASVPKHVITKTISIYIINTYEGIVVIPTNRTAPLKKSSPLSEQSYDFIYSPNLCIPSSCQQTDPVTMHFRFLDSQSEKYAAVFNVYQNLTFNFLPRKITGMPFILLSLHAI